MVLRDSIAFNENSIASVIAVLTLMLGVNGPLISLMDQINFALSTIATRLLFPVKI